MSEVYHLTHSSAKYGLEDIDLFSDMTKAVRVAREYDGGRYEQMIFIPTSRGVWESDRTGHVITKRKVR